MSLPSEVLLMIFNNLDNETLRKCRQVHSSFYNLIDRHKLVRSEMDASCLEIKQLSYGFAVTLSYSNTLTFVNYEELLTALPRLLANIRSLSSLSLYNIDVNDKLLNTLMNAEYMSKIIRLVISHCTFPPNINTQWFQYMKKNLYSITVFGVDMSWLDDAVFKEWYRPGKSINIGECKTGFTLDNIINYYSKNWYGISKKMSYGILIDATPLLVTNRLKELGFTCKERGRNNDFIHYSIRRTDTDQIVYFYCAKDIQPIVNISSSSTVLNFFKNIMANSSSSIEKKANVEAVRATK